MSEKNQFPNYICHLKYKSNPESGKIFFWLISRCYEGHALKMRPLNNWRVHKNLLKTYLLHFRNNFNCSCYLVSQATENLSCGDHNFSRKKWKLIMRDEKENSLRTSLVAQWLRIRLPVQGTQVRALVREDPTCRGATKPVHHNYWACALEPVCHNYWNLCA